MTTMTLITGEAASADDRVRGVVRMLLGAAGMKPAELAERIGMSKHQIWDRLRGDKPFTVAEVAAMAQVFHIDPGAFIAGPSSLLRSAEGAASFRKSWPVRNMRPGVDLTNSGDPVRIKGTHLRLVAA